MGISSSLWSSNDFLSSYQCVPLKICWSQPNGYQLLYGIKTKSIIIVMTILISKLKGLGDYAIFNGIACRICLT